MSTQTKTDISSVLSELNRHLEGKFPKGVRELRDYIFNTHAMLENWMGVAIIRASFKTVENSSLDVTWRSSVMSDASIQVNRLLSVLGFSSMLRVFLKGVPDEEIRKDLNKKIRKVNKVRNEFAHPFGNFDLRAYDLTTKEGVANQVKVLTQLLVALETVEKYLLVYHKNWYLGSIKKTPPKK